MHLGSRRDRASQPAEEDHRRGGIQRIAEAAEDLRESVVRRQHDTRQDICVSVANSGYADSRLRPTVPQRTPLRAGCHTVRRGTMQSTTGR